eukprot:361026-Chlamydomonas_euryale.AAC.11
MPLREKATRVPPNKNEHAIRPGDTRTTTVSAAPTAARRTAGCRRPHRRVLRLRLAGGSGWPGQASHRGARAVAGIGAWNTAASDAASARRRPSAGPLLLAVIAPARSARTRAGRAPPRRRPCTRRHGRPAAGPRADASRSASRRPAIPDRAAAGLARCRRAGRESAGGVGGASAADAGAGGVSAGPASSPWVQLLRAVWARGRRRIWDADEGP